MSQRQELKAFSNVGVFLEAIGKNSRKTRSSYENALVHLDRYVSKTYPELSIDTILPSIIDNKIDIYKLMDDFITYESSKAEEKITPQSLRTYLIGIKSYFGYYDIDITPSKFKRKVKVPKVGRKDEEPVDAADIRRILLSCNNRRHSIIPSIPNLVACKKEFSDSLVCTS
jgi:integrase